MADPRPGADLVDRSSELDGAIMAIGEPDTGKTSTLIEIARRAVAKGKSVALVDGDVAASTVGPATCVGLKYLRGEEDFADLGSPDALRFVGSTSPEGVVLPFVVAVATLVEEAKAHVDLVLVDTTGVTSGVVGQTLKYHLAEMIKPVLVIAMRRGDELEPVVGMLRRFFSIRVAEADPLEDVIPMDPIQRQEARAAAFRVDLGDDPPKWRVQTTVFAPTLPVGFDKSRLHELLVGVQDETGYCLGLGILEHNDGTVRVATRHGDQMRGLRLGSLRVDPATYATTKVRLRELIFGV